MADGYLFSVCKHFFINMATSISDCFPKLNIAIYTIL